MIALPDINVLLALAWSNHAHHDAAHRWFARDATAGWATCLLTQTGFLRLSLNPQVIGVAIDCQAAVTSAPQSRRPSLSSVYRHRTSAHDNPLRRIGAKNRWLPASVRRHAAASGTRWWTEASHIRPTCCGHASLLNHLGRDAWQRHHWQTTRSGR